MKPLTAIQSQISNGCEPFADLLQSLDNIRQKLEGELTAKQRTIECQEKEIKNLWEVINEKTKFIAEQNEKLHENIRNSEGNRQLINKLLGDIERLNQDVEWYKRTYETRSLLGTIKQKIFKRK